MHTAKIGLGIDPDNDKPASENVCLTSRGTLPIFYCNAEVVELVDTRDLKSLGRIARTGSSPVLGTLYRARSSAELIFLRSGLRFFDLGLYFLDSALVLSDDPSPYPYRFTGKARAFVGDECLGVHNGSRAFCKW